MRRRPSSAHRRVATALVVAPVAVALALPASAENTVEVGPAPQGCGVAIVLAVLADGQHVTRITATALATSQPVPLLPETFSPPAPAPELTAVGTVSGDGEVVVVLDAAAVPDADPRVAVVVTVDGAASPAVELALPACSAPATATPEPEPEPEPTSLTSQPTASPADPTTPATPPTQPTSEATSEPTSAPTDPTTAPTEASATPAPVSPSPSASATPTPTPTASLGATTTDTRTTVTPTSAPPAPPVLTAAPVPTPSPSVTGALQQAYGVSGGASSGGTGTSGDLSLVSVAAAPQLDTAPASTPVPAPVIAAPEGTAAGVLAAPQTGTSLTDLLPQAPEDDGDDTPTSQLAAPDLATDADPLVDLAPAAFVLAASLGGMLMTGGRRTS